MSNAKWQTCKQAGIACGVCGKIGTCNVSADRTAFKCWRDGGKVHQMNTRSGSKRDGGVWHGPPGSHTAGLFRWWRALVDCHLSELKHLELKVLLVFLRHSDNTTMQSWPSLTALCKKTGCSSRTRVSAARRALEERGFIQTVQRGGGNGRSAVRRLGRAIVFAADTIPNSQIVCAGDAMVSPMDTRPVSIDVAQTVSPTDTRTTHRTTHSNSPIKGACLSSCDTRGVIL